MKNCISIDWEDWFHICDVEHLLPRAHWDGYPSILEEATDAILELLQQKQTRATFFIVGYSARRQPELVKRIATEGHEIAHHSMEHRLVYTMTSEEFAEDVAAGKELLEGIVGRPVVGYRAPQWSANQRAPWSAGALAQAGYDYDSSRAPLPIVGDRTFPETVHVLAGSRRYGRLLEFPPLVLRFPGVKVPAGGGWGLYTWPLKWICKKAGKLNAAGSPATFFFHPTDFIKQRQVAGLPLLKKFVTAFKPRSLGKTWDFLFDTLEFGPITEIMHQIKLP